MKNIILLRHGESIWNRENRFTGWTDVELSDRGVQEAMRAARMIEAEKLDIRHAFCSVLRRSIRTLDIVLEGIGRSWVTVEKSWRLNEKHYGSLQGLDKRQTAERYGEELVKLWRRSYDVAPRPLDPEDPHNPAFDLRYADVPAEELPLTESLRDTSRRALPYWHCVIMPALRACAGDVLVVAHGNSLRAIVKHLKKISDTDIASLNIPTAQPWLFRFDDRLSLVDDRFLGDTEEVQRLMEAVAAQGLAQG